MVLLSACGTSIDGKYARSGSNDTVTFTDTVILVKRGHVFQSQYMLMFRTWVRGPGSKVKGTSSSYKATFDAQSGSLTTDDPKIFFTLNRSKDSLRINELVYAKVSE